MLSTVTDEDFGELEYKDAVTRFIHSKYDVGTQNIFMVKLSTTNQESFNLIDNYYNAIQDITNILQLINNWDDDQTKNFTDNHFLSHLSHSTKLICAQQSIFYADQTLSFIKEQEDIILSE